MKKLTLTLPAFIKSSKSTLLIVAGLLVFLSLVAFGIVRAEQAKAVQRANDARMQQEARAAVEANIQLVNDLKTQVKSEQAKNAAICDWVRATVANRNQRPVLSVPPLCQLR